MTDGQAPEAQLAAVEAGKRALGSVDALLATNPVLLNEQTSRLRRFMLLRRVAYYSILLPFGLLSRLSPALVLISAIVASASAAVVLILGGGSLPFVTLAYWGIGGLVYHAISVRMVALTEEAAASLGISGKAVLALWTGRPIDA